MMFPSHDRLCPIKGVEAMIDKGDEQTDGFYEHWGWFATIHHLASTSILNITNDDSIPELNFIFVLNYLAYESDKAKRDEQIRKQQERQYRIK